MRTSGSFAQYHVNEVARAVRAAHERLMRDPTIELFVYYRPMQLEAMTIEEAQQSAFAWTLAWPEKVPGNYTVEALDYWFKRRADRVPYLTEGR